MPLGQHQCVFGQRELFPHEHCQALGMRRGAERFGKFVQGYAMGFQRFERQTQAPLTGLLQWRRTGIQTSKANPQLLCELAEIRRSFATRGSDFWHQ